MCYQGVRMTAYPRLRERVATGPMCNEEVEKQAPGALPNGSRVVKVRAKTDDMFGAGELGTVRGSRAEQLIFDRSHAVVGFGILGYFKEGITAEDVEGVREGFAYFVHFDGTPEEAIVLILDEHIEPVGTSA